MRGKLKKVYLLLLLLIYNCLLNGYNCLLNGYNCPLNGYIGTEKLAIMGFERVSLLGNK